MNHLAYLKMAASTAVQFTYALVARQYIGHYPAVAILGIDKDLFIRLNTKNCHYITVKCK